MTLYDTELEFLLDGLPIRGSRNQSPASGSRRITALSVDSRQVGPGTLFFALKGAKDDGRRFLGDAAARGAVAAIVEYDETAAPGGEPDVLPLFYVDDARDVLSRVAAKFYGSPTDSLLSIGVTGTNGKTSIVWIVAGMLSYVSVKPVVVGTLGMSFLVQGPRETLKDFQKTANTTPGPIEMYRFLAQSAGAQALVMEVTSQGLVQKRTNAVHWDTAVFTNLTRDHLDLHGTLENYEAIKTSFFTGELAASRKPKKTAVLNLDDSAGLRIRDKLRGARGDLTCLTYSTRDKSADVYVEHAECGLNGTALTVSLRGCPVELQSRLVGRYNVSNLAASAAVFAVLGYDAPRTAAAVASVLPVPGRLERVGSGEVHVFVDYAHTPDALLNVQRSLRELCQGRLITVFGCGGDRDRGKRPIMGEAVAQLSDYAVVTSDNPRSEDPERIIDDIVPGLKTAQARAGFTWERISAREEAIKQALTLARSGDVVLVAGKGHEDYQEICGVKHPFLDRDVCRGAMEDLGILE